MTRPHRNYEWHNPRNPRCRYSTSIGVASPDADWCSCPPPAADRAQDTEAIRAATDTAKVRFLTHPEDRERLRERAEQDLTAACVPSLPKRSCLEPEVNELGAIVLALLDESDRLVARLEAAERHERALIDRVAEIHRTARAALAAAAPGETEQTP